VLTDIKSLTRDELEVQFKDWKQPVYRVTQLLEWLYARRVSELGRDDQSAQVVARKIARKVFPANASNSSASRARATPRRNSSGNSATASLSKAF
jgi:adenine C2-methylase RlmN of 23S rRNA A2503 and tRNA A37